MPGRVPDCAVGHEHGDAGARPRGRRVQVIFVTVNPERDTPSCSPSTCRYSTRAFSACMAHSRRSPRSPRIFVCSTARAATCRPLHHRPHRGHLRLRPTGRLRLYVKHARGPAGGGGGHQGAAGGEVRKLRKRVRYRVLASSFSLHRLSASVTNSPPERSARSSLHEAPFELMLVKRSASTGPSALTTHPSPV